MLKRRRATPVPAWVLIAGRALTAIVVALVMMTVAARDRARSPTASPADADDPRRRAHRRRRRGRRSACLGYALSTAIRTEDAAQPMVQAIMLPLYFISGVFIPNVNLPPWLRDVAKVFPVQHLADGLHHAYDPADTGAGIVWTDIGVLALWGGIGLAVALCRFSWTPAAASG